MADDLDPVETREWLESLDAVLEFDGLNQAAFLLDELAGQTPALCEAAAAAALTAATPAAARAAAEGLHRTRRGAGPVYTHSSAGSGLPIPNAPHHQDHQQRTPHRQHPPGGHGRRRVTVPQPWTGIDQVSPKEAMDADRVLITAADRCSHRGPGRYCRPGDHISRAGAE